MRSDGELVLFILRLPPERLLLVVVEQGDVSVVGVGYHLGLVWLGHHHLSSVDSPGILVTPGLHWLRRLEGWTDLVLSVR